MTDSTASPVALDLNLSISEKSDGFYQFDVENESSAGHKIFTQSNGKFIVSAYTDAGMTLMRLEQNGAIDSSFGGNGISGLDFFF